ncbi:MAG: GNAT family N-acetyltransferase [Acidimicrobiia bacterium]
MSEPPVLLRPGRPEDLEAIREFTTGTFAWGDYVPDRYLAWLEEESGAVLVATDRVDRAVAIVHVQKMSAREGFLSAARVHPDHQRQGIGSLLNGASVDLLRAQGAVVVRLTTEENNEAARKQVEKLGYRPVARFVMAERTFERHGSEANGGRRLPGPERFDLAPAAEAEPAFMVWTTGESNRAGHGLYPRDGWSFCRLALEDLVRSARQRRLWTSPSGWAVATQDGTDLWVSLLLTTADEADRAVRALIDLAEEMKVEWMGVLVSRVPWIEEALQSEHLTLNYPNIIYERAID